MPHKKADTNRKAPAAPDAPGAFHSPPDLCFTIEDRLGSNRLDLFLNRRHPDYSRNQYKKLILDGAVRVNRQSVKPSYSPAIGDRIEAWLPTLEDTEQLVPEPMSLAILYEDEALIVVDKPPGLVVHPGAGHFTGTLVHGLLAHSPRLALQGAPLRPGIVHRLDRDTSGALVVAKTARTYLSLIEQFKAHTVTKQYLALVYGPFRSSRGTIHTPIGRHPKNRKKMAVVPSGRDAISHWQLVEVPGGLSLVRVIIETGRTHQIRVHMNHAGHPVVGDACYGGGRKRALSVASKPVRDILLKVERQLLHAHRLGIRHPESGKWMDFEAPLPEDFEYVLESLRKTTPPSSR